MGILLYILILLFVFAPLAAALAVGIRTNGWKRALAWGLLAVMSLALLVGVGGNRCLARFGLAWRDTVLNPCIWTYCCGVMGLLFWGGVHLLWTLCSHEKTAVQPLRTSGMIVLLFAAWFLYFIFCGINTSSERVIERNGRTIVVEYIWLDDVYYDDHGPYVRGNRRHYTPDWDPEAEKAWDEVRATLGFSVTGGELEAYTESHGGFHGDGETFIQLRFDDEELEERIKEADGWQVLPLSEDLRRLAGYTEGRETILAAENGCYWFYDRHSQATDRRDAGAATERYSFNFTLAVYDMDERRLYFCEIDT